MSTLYWEVDGRIAWKAKETRGNARWIKGLKESLKACKQSIVEDRLRSLCIEIDEAREVTILTSENELFYLLYDHILLIDCAIYIYTRLQSQRKGTLKQGWPNWVI